MPKFQYTIRGTRYQDTPLDQHLNSLLLLYHCQAKFHETKSRVVIELEGEEASIRALEPELLKEMSQVFNIHSFIKTASDMRAKRMKKRVSENKTLEEELKRAVKLLNRGDIVAVETSEGFHLVCNAAKTNAIKKLRTLLSQPTKPFPVIFKNLISAQKYTLLSKIEKALLSQPDHPFVIVRKKNLHRLEKERYKHILSPHLNPLNRRLETALTPTPFYEKIFSEVTFPLTCVQAKMDGKVITDAKTLQEKFGESIKQICHDRENVLPHSVWQVIYGKPVRMDKEIVPSLPAQYTDIKLDFEITNIGKLTLAPMRILLDASGKEQPLYSALSLLFAAKPIENIDFSQFPIDAETISDLHQKWERNENTIQSRSLLTLFDAIAALSGTLYQKTFQTESLLLAEGHFEVCEENLFDYDITENTFSIDIVSAWMKNAKLKHLASTLANTVAQIITDEAVTCGQTVYLHGSLLHFRDMTELAIEKLKDANLEVIY